MGWRGGIRRQAGEAEEEWVNERKGDRERGGRKWERKRGRNRERVR